jgi:hypothetical protein
VGLFKTRRKRLMQTRVRFAGSLSDGTNFFEDKGLFVGDEAASSWRKLLAYVNEKGLQFTSFMLTVDGYCYHLPSLGANPKFRSVNGAKPLSYNFFRKIASESNTPQSERTVVDHYTVAEAIYEGYRTQLWINEINTKDLRIVVQVED